MKTTLTYTSRNTLVPWPTLLTEQLGHWRSLMAITEAEIVLTHQRANARAFGVVVRLEVSGPGLRAEVCDATLEGALLKATQNLESQIAARKIKPVGPRPETNPPPSGAPSRGRSRHPA